MGKEIFVTKAYLPPRAEFDEYLDRIWDSAWLTNMGRLHEQLKGELAGYLGVDGIELFVNGHLALETCIQAFGFPRGSEVITTPFSFASTTHAIVRQGLRPVFADVRKSDCTIDPEKIEELITERTVAILPVHVYGNICDVEAIRKIADRHGLKVIYDAAHAFGETVYMSDAGHGDVECSWDSMKSGTVTERGIGTFGDASMFSFHATKVFNTIEGGAVAWNNKVQTDHAAGAYEQDADRYAGSALADGSGVRLDLSGKSDFAGKLYRLKNFGITGQEQVDLVGGNAKMNEFQAAMGLCNLRHIEELIEARRRIYDRYMEGLGLVKGRPAGFGASGTAVPDRRISCPEIPEPGGIRCLLGDADCPVSYGKSDGQTGDMPCAAGISVIKVKRNFAYFPVLFETAQRRDEVFNKLAVRGIHARKYFYPCINDYECYRDEYDSSDTPVAKDLASRVLTLPIYHDLETDIVDEICRTILE